MKKSITFEEYKEIIKAEVNSVFGYCKKINFIKKFEVEILVTSLENNKTYKIKN